MKYIPSAVTRTIARQVLLTQKHSPTILFGVGIVGVVGATVMACRATLKLETVLQTTEANLEIAKELKTQDRIDYTPMDYRKDVTYIYTRSLKSLAGLYGPALIVGSLSVAALTGSHRILSSRNAAITAAYAAMEKGFSEYRRRVVDEFGEEKERELRYSSEERTLVEDTKNGPKKVQVKRVGPEGASIYAKFFDETSKAWSPTPEYNRVFLQCQQEYATQKLWAQGHLFLNEVYDMLGIDRTGAGAVVGWVITKDGSSDNYVDFGIFNNERRVRDFVNGHEGSILLDFNVDGVIWDKI